MPEKSLENERGSIPPSSRFFCDSLQLDIRPLVTECERRRALWERGRKVDPTDRSTLVSPLIVVCHLHAAAPPRQFNCGTHELVPPVEKVLCLGGPGAVDQRRVCVLFMDGHTWLTNPTPTLACLLVFVCLCVCAHICKKGGGGGPYVNKLGSSGTLNSPIFVGGKQTQPALRRHTQVSCAQDGHCVQRLKRRWEV